MVSADRHRPPSASWMNILLSSPSADKIRLQCPRRPRGRSYIIKYSKVGGLWGRQGGSVALRFVIQSLDCLNIYGRGCDESWIGEGGGRGG